MFIKSVFERNKKENNTKNKCYILRSKDRTVTVLYLSTALLFLLFFGFFSEFSFDSESSDYIQSGLGVILCLIGLLVWGMTLYFVIDSRKTIQYSATSISIVLGLFNYTICEIVNSRTPIKDYFPFVLLGIMLYVFIFELGTILLPNPKIWFLIMNTLCIIFTIIQFYVIDFRGTPIRLFDFLNLKSALAIEGEYDFYISTQIALAIVVFCVNTILILLMRFKKTKTKTRMASSGILLVCIVAFSFLSKTMFTSTNGFLKSRPDTMPESAGSMNLIFYDLLNFRVTQPDNYSPQNVEKKLEEYTANNNYTATPIVICILNESFADYSHISKFSASKDPVSVWRSLKENTVKGYVYVSPYGGGTSNSEYEFLTGNSIFFLPEGSTPFTTYIKNHRYSLVDTFKNYGFDTVGLSPANKNIWDVEKVYNYLGFDKTMFINGGDELLDYSTGMDGNFYKKIESIADNRDKSKGLFVWAATMQNHSPYNSYLTNEVDLKKPYDNTAEMYLNSEYLSDKATLELINHFKNYDEKVIVLMFGDHFPRLETFENELLNERKDLTDIEKTAITHHTPYLIWSNRELFHKEISEISLNYLSNEVFKAAGLPLTPVQQELEHIRKSIPVITDWGYKSRDGKWHSKDDSADDKYKGVLDEYSSLCYYRLFEEKPNY